MREDVIYMSVYFTELYFIEINISLCYNWLLLYKTRTEILQQLHSAILIDLIFCRKFKLLKIVIQRIIHFFLQSVNK